MSSLSGITLYHDKPLVRVLWNGLWLEARLIAKQDDRVAVEIPSLGRGGVQYVLTDQVKGMPKAKTF